MAKKLALGKGIASLLQEVPKEIIPPAALIKEQIKQTKEVEDTNPSLIPIEMIKPNPKQPRRIFKEKEIQELANSIKENGIIQPIIISKSENGFELIAGERRLRAAKLAGLDRIPAILKRVTEKEKVVMAILENVQRMDLNCVEEAFAYYQLISEFNLTQEEVAKRLGKERSSVANLLRILKLPRAVRELLQKDLLSLGHAKVLAGVEDLEKATKLANDAVAHGWSVRELEDQSKKTKSKPRHAEQDNSFQVKLDSLKDNLEKRTGLQFKITAKNKGGGIVALPFGNEAEFNDIYNYLMSQK